MLFLPLFILGCDDNNNSINGTAVTENDFCNDPNLMANPEEGVVVSFLENPMSGEPECDTGELGVDEIPVTYRQTVEQQFCWVDDDTEAMHFMELVDSQESVILTLEANGNCVTEVIEAGNYLLSIHHDGSNEDSLPIFLNPNPEESEQARETGGLIDRFKLVASNILK
jgi:hypothetical protein